MKKNLIDRSMPVYHPNLICLLFLLVQVDMEDIKQAYQAAYGKPLEKAIEGDTSGDYRRMLMAMVRGN